MELTQALLLMIACFVFGSVLTCFVLWLVFFGIPKLIFLKDQKFEKKVKEVIKRNYDKPMNITKEYIKDLIKEVLRAKH